MIKNEQLHKLSMCFSCFLTVDLAVKKKYSGPARQRKDAHAQNATTCHEAETTLVTPARTFHCTVSLQVLRLARTELRVQCPRLKAVRTVGRGRSSHAPYSAMDDKLVGAVRRHSSTR